MARPSRRTRGTESSRRSPRTIWKPPISKANTKKRNQGNEWEERMLKEGNTSRTTLKWTLLGVAAIAVVAIGGSQIRAQEKPSYVIGYVGPITGPNTSVGVGTMNSLDLAIKQANAKGDLPF